ncbi:hypothetical protein RDWZM_009988 [Blomia tropicalis]|uniref:Blo t Mag29 allergen n=1 Tax=Blomia tropicalis TaxID=40697 RepID=A0A9Q0LYK3_BLOTA|nr:hypothetical protein RDWZM_009988 [Blomia tropicalis]
MEDIVPPIGIDLGTTNSCVAIWEYGTIEVISNQHGKRITPSYVAFNDDGCLVGEPALAQSGSNPTKTIHATKRLMGKRFDDQTVQDNIKNYHYQVVNNEGFPNIEVEVNGLVKRFRPEQIGSMILAKIKESVEVYLGKKVSDAIITVPAYFNDAQRTATKIAGQIAGLNVIRIINEPTAAALAYGYGTMAHGERNILVFDLGGGTFDVSIVNIDNGNIEVKSTCGDTNLGGEDFDTRLVSYMINQYKEKMGVDVSNDYRAVRRLRNACELAKRTLSNSTMTMVEIESFYGGMPFKSSISRAKFENLCSDLFQKTIDLVERAMLDSRLEKNDIDEVIMVGGSSRIPAVRRLLSAYFDGKQLNHSINEDEAVAYGAAVQGAIMANIETNQIQDMVLLDLIPMSIGIETYDQMMVPIIPRNTTVPIEMVCYAEPGQIGQSSVYITVFEGERAKTYDNNRLGQFLLDGLMPMDNGQSPLIEVKYCINEDGMLNVSARDLASNRFKEMTISAQDRLRFSTIEIERMRNEALRFMEQDRNEIKRIESKNILERYLEHLNKIIDGIDFDRKDTVKRYHDQTKDWFESNLNASAELMKEKFDTIREVCDPILKREFDQ